jgi:hypothetical protein
MEVLRQYQAEENNENTRTGKSPWGVRCRVILHHRPTLMVEILRVVCTSIGFKRGISRRENASCF